MAKINFEKVYLKSPKPRSLGLFNGAGEGT